MEDLTQAEKATNAETWEHINLVMKLLASAQVELMRRQFTHDRSKLSDPEVSAFTKYTPMLKESTYGSDQYKQFLVDMKPALDHHYAHNRHHPEFFDDGVEGMNLFDLIEMILDWYAASKRHDNGDVRRSIEINTERFGLSDQLVRILQNTVPWIDDEFSVPKTQRDLAHSRGLRVNRLSE